MADLPWWSWLGVGLFVALSSSWAGISLFAFVGYVFVVVGVVKIVMLYVNGPSKSKEVSVVHCSCGTLVYVQDRFCRGCGVRLNK